MFAGWRRGGGMKAGRRALAGCATCIAAWHHLQRAQAKITLARTQSAKRCCVSVRWHRASLGAASARTRRELDAAWRALVGA